MTYQTGDEVVIQQGNSYLKATIVMCNKPITHEYDESSMPILVEGPNIIKVKDHNGKNFDVKKENILGPLDIKRLQRLQKDILDRI